MPFANIQQGGSSHEFYVSGWETTAEAESHIADCKAHTYDAIGPFPLPAGLTREQEAAVYTLLEEVVKAVTTAW